MRAVLLREGDRIRAFAPYCPDFIADLKSEIPYHAKHWDGDARNWVVDGDYEEPLIEISERHFDVLIAVSELDSVRRERAARASAAPPPQAQPPHDTNECARRVRGIWREEAELYLLPGAPFSVIQAAYRAVAKLFHPDVAGSDGHARMVAVNRAYDTLERRSKGATA